MTQLNWHCLESRINSMLRRRKIRLCCKWHVVTLMRLMCAIMAFYYYGVYLRQKQLCDSLMISINKHVNYNITCIIIHVLVIKFTYRDNWGPINNSSAIEMITHPTQYICCVCKYLATTHQVWMWWPWAVYS